MRNLDFTSWQTLLSTLVGLVVVSIIAIGIRLVLMQTVQQRRERENRQVNERLRTLIGAYKTLGGSFTGDLAVDPTHLRELRSQPAAGVEGAREIASSDRSRRIRDVVENALSDVILLGTEQQVRLAARAAQDLAAGRSTNTDELVVSLRNFIRDVLDLDAVPAGLVVPKQGPSRSLGGGAKGGAREESKQGQGGAGLGGMAAGGGMGLGAGMGAGGGLPHDEEHEA
ncbi:MAG: hypothetical protein WDO12_14265 [Pseudomonadota bacterium]